jgi:hypothetical protein
MPEKDYSHRSAVDKLGIQPGAAVRVLGRGEPGLLAQVRERAGRPPIHTGLADVVLYWPTTVAEITPRLAELRRQIVPNGGIWVITAKRAQVSSSGMGYLNQSDLIPLGQAAGLVDNKTCSVNDQESGMRFVIRRVDRPGAAPA